MGVAAQNGTSTQIPGSSEQPADSLPAQWDLQACIDYALQQNITIRKNRLSAESAQVDVKTARAALFPSLSASVSQRVVNRPKSETNTIIDGDNITSSQSKTSYNGSYGIDANWTLYNGGKRLNTIKQQQLNNRIAELSVAQSENSIEESIAQTYVQILYAAEAVEVAAGTAEVSRAQRDRAEQMWQAGSISKVDFAQLESQYASDLYQVVVARSSLDDYKLQLKQLLELDITEEMNLAAPAEGEETVLQALPAKTDIYATALDAMPQIERGRLGVETAELGIREARAGFYPSVSLTAGLGTGHMTGGGFQSGSQVWNRFNENVALSVNIPIFSNRKNRTAVNKARIAASNSRLEQLGLKKELLRKVESAYLDAISSQSRYTAARQKERYARQSYDLTDEQFRVGRKNTVELITAQNELSSARQEVLQAKYMAILNTQLLKFYQGEKITL